MHDNAPSYKDCISVFDLVRPKITPHLAEHPSLRSNSLMQCISPENRFLPKLIAKHLDFPAFPLQLDPVIENLARLTPAKLSHLLIALGMCFCHTHSEHTLEDPTAVERLKGINEDLPAFFTMKAHQYGEFYEPNSSTILENMMLNDDELDNDMLAIGISLLSGYLDKVQPELVGAFWLRCDPSLQVIRQIRSVPQSLLEDPTGKILERILIDIPSLSEEDS